MSHTPPIPAANTSPFPRQEPPHDHSHAAVKTPPPARKAKAKQGAPVTLGWPVVAGAIAVGAGLIGGLLYALSGDEAQATGKGRGKRRRASGD